jgi:hypothetical protein
MASLQLQRVAYFAAIWFVLARFNANAMVAFTTKRSQLVPCKEDHHGAWSSSRQNDVARNAPCAFKELSSNQHETERRELFSISTLSWALSKLMGDPSESSLSSFDGSDATSAPSPVPNPPSPLPTTMPAPPSPSLTTQPRHFIDTIQW